MTVGRVPLAAYAAAMVVAYAPFARAEAPVRDTFALNWVRQTGAEACVSSAELARLLEQLLGPVLRTPADANLLVEGVVTRAPAASRWRAVIRVTDRAGQLVGERALTNGGPACASLTRSILLVLAVLIDPESADRGFPPDVIDSLATREREPVTEESVAPGFAIEDVTAPSPPAHEPGVVSRTKPETHRAPEPEASRYGAPRLHVGAMTGAGHVPGLGAGGNVGLGFALGRSFHLTVDVGIWAANAVEVKSQFTAPGDVSFNATHATASLCHPLMRSPVEVSACAGAMVGIRSVDAAPLAFGRDPSRAYYGPALSLEADWLLHPTWFLRASLTGAVPVTRDYFEYQNQDGTWSEVFEPSSVHLAATLGAGARL